MKRILATMLAAAMASTSTVTLAQPPVTQAQSSSCAAICQATLGQPPLQQQIICALPISRQGPVASVSQVDGQILQAAERGFVPIAQEALLSLGDQLFVGEHSSAHLIAGPTCRAKLTGQAVINFTPVNNCGCITQAEVRVFAADLVLPEEMVEPEVPVLPPPPPPAPHIPPAAIGAVGAAGVLGLILLLRDRDDRPPFIPRRPVS